MFYIDFSRIIKGHLFRYKKHVFSNKLKNLSYRNRRNGIFSESDFREEMTSVILNILAECSEGHRKCNSKLFVVAMLSKIVASINGCFERLFLQYRLYFERVAKGFILKARLYKMILFERLSIQKDIF